MYAGAASAAVGRSEQALGGKAGSERLVLVYAPAKADGAKPGLGRPCAHALGSWLSLLEWLSKPCSIGVSPPGRQMQPSHLMTL
jgi:hypothetical protein